MASPGLTGFASGLVNAPLAPTQGRQMGEERAEAREAAQQRKAQADLQYERDQLAFKQAQTLEPLQTQVTTEMLQQQQQVLQQQGMKMVKDSSYQATSAYLEDFDIRHFNNFFTDMKQNPFAPAEFKNVVRVDKLNPQGPEHKTLIQRLGLTDAQLDEMDGETDGKIDWDTVGKRFVVMTRPDGSQDLRDVYQFGILSGYAEWAEDKKIAKLTSLANIRNKSTGSSGFTPTSIKEAERAAEARTRVQNGTETQEDIEFLRLIDGKSGGVTPRRKGFGDDARAILRDSNFLELDPEEILKEGTPETQRYMDLVRDIEMSTGLSREDKKVVTKAVSDIASLQRAINLDPETQGFIDAPLTALGKYFKENSPGRAASTAYNNWLNQVRNDLFGVALSQNEISMFNRAYGTDKQAMTVALYGLRELMTGIEGALHAVSLQNDPFVSHVRLGKSRQELQGARDNLKARITFYETFEKQRSEGKSIQQATVTAIKAAGLGVNEDGTLKVVPEWDLSGLTPPPASSGTSSPAAPTRPAGERRPLSAIFQQ